MMEKKMEHRMEKNENRGKNREKSKKSIRPACSKGKKYLLTAAGCLLVCAGAAGAVFLNRPVSEEETRPVYTYQLQADMPYRVHLLPNELYEQEWLEPGQVYAERLTDYIEVVPGVRLSGNREVVIEGTYGITAVVEGYQLSGEKRRQIYEKRYPLKQGRIRQTDAGTAEASERLQINMTEYRDYVGQAELVLGASTGKAFYLLFDGSVQVDMNGTKKESEFSLQLAIPIGNGQSLYDIPVLSPFIQEETVNETVTVTKEPDSNRVRAAVAAAIAGGVVALFSLIGLRLPSEEEAWQAGMSKILKRYGSRMICVDRLPEQEAEEILDVKDMDSLIYMAEELRQPVIYSLDENEYPADGRFCILDRNRCYQVHRPRPEPVAEPESETGPESVAEPESEAGSESEARPEPEAGSESEARPEPEPEAGEQGSATLVAEDSAEKGTENQPPG